MAYLTSTAPDTISADHAQIQIPPAQVDLAPPLDENCFGGVNSDTWAIQQPLLRSFLAADDRWRHVVLSATAILFVIGFNGQWQMEPDSALYLTLARSLARGQGYVYHGLPHHLVYPGLPLMLAAMYRIFPAHFIPACDVLMLACGLAAMGLMYRLFTLASDRPTAVVVTVLTGTAHEFVRYGYTIMTEMPFLAGVLAIFAGYEAIFLRATAPRRRDWFIFWSGVVAIIVLKPMMLPLLVICMVAAPWRKTRHNSPLRTAWIAGTIFGLVFLFYCFDPRHPFSSAGTSSYEQLATREFTSLPRRWRDDVGRNLEDLLGKAAARAVIGIPLGVPKLTGILSLVLLAGGVRLFWFRPAWGLWVAAILVKLTLLCSRERYLLPILPLLMFGWFLTMCRISRSLPRKLGELVFTILLTMTFLPNAIASGLCVAEQHRHPFLAHYRYGHFLAVSKIADAITAHTTADAVILAPIKSSRILTFLTDRTVLDSSNAMVDLRQRAVFIVKAADNDDDTFEPFLNRLQVVPSNDPLATITYSPRRGGTISLFAADLGTRNK